MVGLLPSLQEDYQVGILDQYYKVVTDFERLGDHAVNIADGAAYLAEAEVDFSPSAKAELHVMEELLQEIMELAERSFQHRDVDAAYRIEPLVEVADELIGSLKMSHLNRMVSGECNVYADASFMNLLTDLKRIADVCSNIGEATVVRANPQLADEEHNYFSSLRSGRNETFNRQYREYHERFSDKMKECGKAQAE